MSDALQLLSTISRSCWSHSGIPAGNDSMQKSTILLSSALISCSWTLFGGVPVNSEDAPAATDDASTTINTITMIFLDAINSYINEHSRIFNVSDYIYLIVTSKSSQITLL
jgi:hypothetical protein